MWYTQHTHIHTCTHMYTHRQKVIVLLFSIISVTSVIFPEASMHELNVFFPHVLKEIKNTLSFIFWNDLLSKLPKTEKITFYLPKRWSPFVSEKKTIKKNSRDTAVSQLTEQKECLSGFQISCYGRSGSSRPTFTFSSFQERNQSCVGLVSCLLVRIWKTWAAVLKFQE